MGKGSGVAEVTAELVEAGTLEQLEAVVEANLSGALTVARALAAIHGRRLYRERYGTWEAYCLERWHLSRSAAWRQIAQARAQAELPVGSPPPPQEPAEARAARRQRRAAQNVADNPSAVPPTRGNAPSVHDICTAVEAASFDRPGTPQEERWEITITDPELCRAVTEAALGAGVHPWEWVAGACRLALEAVAETPPPRRPRQRAAAQPRRPREQPAGKCPHPMPRRSKGLCFACGEQVP